ncbi:aquaporin-10b isoform X3 [Tachysurus fulvidraco]|uniref:aquaporin-10b isoform X3 n=1 Tax=Tachysurus fulvidraco TaxID=1234273 RepID=UPI000F4E9412|nr:aquaporin-10b isoform X3 [Tachysurus fulvidraco]
MDRVLKRCHISNRLVRECFAEFLGVYVLILFGCGSVAQVTTSKNSKGEYLSINLAFALGTTFGIYVSKGISGAHLNPAVSLSLCFLGRFSWTRLPFYVISQVFGAFLAAATVALQYFDAIIYYSGDHLTVSGPTGTAGIFSTYPAEYLSVWGGVVDQVIGTAALMVCVLALGDSRNFPGPPGLEPVLVGAVVMVIGLSMGSNSGYALNPARDLGPRIFTCIAGWGTEVFSRGWLATTEYHQPLMKENHMKVGRMKSQFGPELRNSKKKKQALAVALVLSGRARETAMEIPGCNTKTGDDGRCCKHGGN